MQPEKVYFLLYAAGANTTPANCKSIRLTAPSTNPLGVLLTDSLGNTYNMEAGETVLLSAELNCLLEQFTVTPAVGCTCKVAYIG
jgi:hypothetical protein